ncbi:DUF1343 domain-containing protein [candidate division KSB1 bacterium]|nr:DUF1343 domain-containing protein [candidate division KSB1 bacterium]
MQLGIDMLKIRSDLREELYGRRIAVLGHPASVDGQGTSTLDVLAAMPEIRLVCAFGPQHGMLGTKQDNMIESDDDVDPVHNVPIFSLYTSQRRPLPYMMDIFDVLLIDLQDIGTRIYTYVTTTIYMLQACAERGKRVFILDRPNPAGRTIEGTILQSGWESFVGAAPMIMRHGLTLGELALWYINYTNLEVDFTLVPMQDYFPRHPPGYGWPVNELAWVNPSPNAGSLNMARCFPGTVLFEGTTLSEGRGTTRPLEMVGAPDVDMQKILHRMTDLAPHWLKGCLIRPCCFEPVFHKHAGQVCNGLQFHTDYADYDPVQFLPYRLCALLLKCLRLEYPDYPLWRQFEYEYETERLAIDLLSGSTLLKQWIDDPAAQISDFELLLQKDEKEWKEKREPFMVY